MPAADAPTDEVLTFGERVSWRIQGLIRRWTMLIVITVGTVAIFTYAAVEVGASLHSGAEALLTWWNLWASWMALMIEGTVGIAMFSMAKRTALKLKQVLEILRRLDHVIEHHPTIPPLEGE